LDEWIVVWLQIKEIYTKEFFYIFQNAPFEILPGTKNKTHFLLRKEVMADKKALNSN